jgi:malonyl-CoA O-methyltransferase
VLADSLFDKKDVRKAFSQAVSSYDAMAALQRTAGKDLLKYERIERLTGTVLDIGCGTGFLTGELLNSLNCQQLIALDLALPMIKATRKKYSAVTNLQYLCADAEWLPLADNVVDRVFSNVALQWCQDLSAVFAEITRILKPNGSLVFSTFGCQTLQELKQAWASVDNFSHVNEFYNDEQIRESLSALGYQEIVITEKVHTSHYDSVMALMRELKGIGAHNVMAGRNHNMTGKSKMQAMINYYETLQVNNKIPATFEIINVSCRNKESSYL